MPIFTIKTLGCKVNQYESEAIACSLQKLGWIMANGEENADLCIVNSCTVTQKASMQSRQVIRQLIRSNPDACIYVTGCYAQMEPDAIKKIQGIHYIIGNADKLKIPALITSRKESEEKVSSYPINIHQNIFDEYHFKQPSLTVFGNRTRPLLKIQDGCNNFCTYCIVPYARGRSRSMPLENVLENIKQLKQAGHREVVLSGIDLGCYGLDLHPHPSRLLDLLYRINESKAIDRVRLSSIEPRKITEPLIKLVAESDIFCHHFHIPLQSGDDHILKRMHRPYTNSFFRELILKIHQTIPDAAIGVDILIGFPGETEESFEKTYSLIKDLPIAYLHVFPFSSRKGTPAGKYPDKVPAKVIKMRCDKIRKLGDIKTENFYKKLKGQKVKILIEGKKNPSSGLLKGMTSSYVPVLFRGSGDVLINTLVSVRIKGLHENNSLFGVICERN
ncbi:MAG: tRNA (N(6)-L-threonylcarbamoyladenosine(37)-C(2))-methylthiotransferase MtaB [Desulfobacterales bacterium]|nr:tRNA (N(6)-L-threonylcarbamoyladenosine(37)-C(2))-methylthiotransferase MtaB [Desulfobacterales bacterium]